MEEKLNSLETFFWHPIILTGIVILLIIWWFAYYIKLKNHIVDLQETRKNAWSDIDVQLRARFDLVDNLVSTVKGYAKHEKDTLENIVKARHMFNAVSSGDVKGRAEADNFLTGTLKTLFATVEAQYPELKADKNFLNLQSELSEIEYKIASARRYYNAATKEYNTEIKQFPASFLFHYPAEDYFEGSEEEKKAPKVSFD